VVVQMARIKKKDTLWNNKTSYFMPFG